jgi:hypothetical protein
VASLVDLFRQIIERGFNRGDLSVADEICSDALIEHEYLAPNARGAEHEVKRYKAANPLISMYSMCAASKTVG